MKVLSLFDGISVAQQALKELGANIEAYYSSEIDKYALQVTQKNHPNTIQLGDVKNVFRDKVGKIDLLIGGSPCQDLSIAKQNREGLAGARSGLFFEYVRIMREVKPKYFVLENVASMPKEARAEITRIMGVEPIMINAALVSAQQRKRLFWTNIPNVDQPEDRGIYLKDIILDGNTEDIKSLCITASYYKKNVHNWHKRDGQMVKIGNIGSDAQAHRVYSIEGKSVTLSALGGGQGAKTGLYAVALRNRGQGKKPEIGGDKANAITTVQTDSMVWDNAIIRKLTPIECERLQSLPDNYTAGVSNTQRYKALGNAFNCEVVKHILKNIVCK